MMKFTVHPKADLPADPKDKFAPIVAAFGQLTGSEVLFIEPDAAGPATARHIGQMVSALGKRIEKDQVEFRKDVEGGGLWLVPKRPRAAGGSTAPAPLDPPTPRASGAVAG